MTTLRELYVFVGTQEREYLLVVKTPEEEKKAMWDFKTTLLWYAAMLVIYL